jgi:uncharacterized membrane protein
MKAIGFILIMVGLMVAAGSANDCDGACMETANSLGDMLLIAAAGIFSIFVGILAVFHAERG